MPVPDPIEITNVNGIETHPSWIQARFNNVSASPGVKLFDSEIRHQSFVRLTVETCARERDLYRDWLHGKKVLFEIDFSKAQFGALVSSFGTSGVPATLARDINGLVPGVATDDSRLGKSHEDVRNAANKGMEEVRAASRSVSEAVEQNLGKRELRERLRTLENRVANLPSNLEFAAQSLSEHAEKVTVKMRADVEAMVFNANKNAELSTPTEQFQLPN